MRSEALKRAQKKYRKSKKGKLAVKKATNKFLKTEKGKQSQKKYAQSSKGKLRAKKGQKKYQQTEKGKKTILKAQLAYYHRRIKKDPDFKLAIAMRNRLRSYLRTKGLNKNNETMELVGCSKKFLREHLEKQFKPGMNWSNHSLRGWHIDHIRPLSKFDFTHPEELKKACHYSNLQPLWSKENLKKFNKETT